MRSILAVLCLVLFAACRSTGQAVSTPSPAATLTGEVNILTPQEGTLIYAEVIRISGTAANVPEDKFELALVGPDEVELTTSMIHASDGKWAIELPHTYDDVPAEVIITARSTNPDITNDYDLVTVALAGIEYRPEGTFGSITFPAGGSTVGGEQFQVGGTVSGLSDQQLTLSLLAADGTILDSKTLTIDHPYPLDDVPWSGELTTGEYLGEAVIQIGANDQPPLDSVDILVETAAG